MNNDKPNHDALNVGGLFSRHLSDEAAVTLCNFLSELLAVAERRYSQQLWRYYELRRPPANTQYPWRTKVRVD